jgi:hypothetical protein
MAMGVIAIGLHSHERRLVLSLLQWVAEGIANTGA